MEFVKFLIFRAESSSPRNGTANTARISVHTVSSEPPWL